MPGVRDRAGPSGQRHDRRCGPNAACAATPVPSTSLMVPGTVTGDRDGGRQDPGRAAGGAAGPERGQRGSRRARYLPAAGAAAPHRHRHRPRRASPHPVRAHPRLGVPAVRRTGPAATRRTMPRRLAPGPRAGHGAGSGELPSSRQGSPTGPRCKQTGMRWPPKALRPPSWTSGSASWTSRSPPPGCEATFFPRGRAATAPPGAGRMLRRCPAAGQRLHGRHDLHRAGRQGLPPVDVRHADLPELRPGLRVRSTRRPGHLRLSPRRPRCAGLRRAVRPVHPEPAPVRRP